MLNFLSAFRRKNARKGTEGNKKTIYTSVTLDYEKDKWGYGRIALDGIQNHMPADSKGKNVYIKYLVDGKWIDKKEYKEGKIKDIQFSDDGAGFDYESLGVFHSSKKGERGAVGEFGEGLKLISAACERNKIDIEIESQNWSAKPAIEKKKINGDKVKKMNYDVNFKEAPIKGSVTTFRNCPKEFVDEVTNIGDSVLFFRENYNPLFSHKEQSVVDESSYVFVKGFKVSEKFKEDLIYGYDLKIKTSRDRDMISNDEIVWAMSKLLKKCEDKKILGEIIERGVNERDHDYLEFLAVSNLRHKHEFCKKFVEVAEEKFGKILLLRDNHKELYRKSAEMLGYKTIQVNKNLESVLERGGLKYAQDFIDKTTIFSLTGEEFDAKKLNEVFINTSISLDYRAKKWGKKRIVMDTVQNHLPSDTGGTGIGIWYKTDENELKGKKDVYSFDTIKETIITDNGRGYSEKHLGILHSDKEKESVGEMGEGMKMLAAACLREGIPIKYRSRDWVAVPVAKEEYVDGKKVDILCFRVLKNLKEIKGSKTVMLNEGNIHKQFMEANKYILQLRENYDPISSFENSEIVDCASGNNMGHGIYDGMFVRGFHINDCSRRLFNYNLFEADISPDRDMFNMEKAKPEIKKMIENCKNEIVPTSIIKYAKSRSNSDYIEFEKYEFEDRKIKELWKNSFFDLFGEDAVLSTCQEYAQEAKEDGFNPIGLEEKIASTLKDCGVITDGDVLGSGYKYKWVKYEELTANEKTIFDKRKRIYELAAGNPVDIETKIFKNMYKKNLRTGKLKKINDTEALWSKSKREIYVKRTSLSNEEDFANVLFHEVSHKESGADDRTREFENYLTKAWARTVVKEKLI